MAVSRKTGETDVMKKTLLCMSLLLGGAVMAAPPKTLPSWEEGELEFHVICTGRGESLFMIMPDGTSMLIDAGDWNDLWDEMTPAMPDGRYRAGEYIRRYIRKVNPNDSIVDYLMVSHFHNDHTGDTTVRGLPETKGKDPDYVVCGIMEVGEGIRFGKEFDRGYPDYSYPVRIDDPDVDNLRAFLRNEARENGLVQEAFKVGALNQVNMTHNWAKYSDLFSIRNLAANGEVWTGDGTSTVKCYDLNRKNKTGGQNENTKSLAVRIEYGPFALYTGGDLTGSLLDERGQRFNLEDMVGKVCGHVDVAKLNHHGYRGSTSAGYVGSIDARHYLDPAWDYWHIQPSVMKNIYEGGRYEGHPMVFSTHVFYSHLKEFGNEPWFRVINPEFGHIVVKVDKGGETYRIFVVDARDEEMAVLRECGPFKSGIHTARQSKTE